ncbi:family 16 glycoside hydrolase [Pseudochryseolinea flava]|uniref:Glycosyl hydrolase n=1 Tax=Pseudochryseolinea flava TaxID=2059302 RepID=A0A364XVK5_9BACT|nr:family 16 glycoside hydrolase [Pseudochryseolinea flava]RAV98138.1 glycosyl hydrolase [Pseudochryseolinea flava]
MIRKNILQLLAVSLLTLSFISCNSRKEIKRPRDPWVFRSVLDSKPRMITVALNDNLYVAYSAQTCELYKAWKGGVIFDGAVYTTHHGPQPSSKGYAYFVQQDEDFWYLVRGENESPAKTNFKGYSIKNDKVTFHFELSDENGNTVLMDETPEYESRGDQPGLTRTFQIVNATVETKVKIKTKLSNLQQPDDYSSTGDLKVIKSNEKKDAKGTTHEVDVEVLLNAQDKTNLQVYFHPGFEEKVEEKEAQPVDVVAQGASLIETSDCKTCHNEKVKTVGPAYLDIAKKYASTEANLNTLAEKVIDGGSGNWGAVPMSAHPDLTPEDAAKMITYVLSLDGEKFETKVEGNNNITAGKSFVTVDLDEKNAFEQLDANKEYPGLATSIYTLESSGNDLYELPKQRDPIYTMVAPVLHFNQESFKNAPRSRENMLLHAKGFITVEKDDNFVFRLVSDDGSRMWLDNKMLIDNDGFHSAQPKEAEITLKKGKHPVEVIYYQGAGDLMLSLQWATHDKGAFTVIEENNFVHTKSHFKRSIPYVSMDKLVKNVPGDKRDEAGLHPSFKLEQARPSTFEPKVGGMDFLSDSSLIVCTWDSTGPVYKLEGVTRHDPEKIKVTRIASGLAEPLGVKVVNDTLYVLQKQELTRLLDTDRDGIIDEYQTVCDGWKVSANFHEFAFGLAYKDGYFYAALATAINPGGASTQPQIPDRGKVIKISKKDGSFEFIASGLRTPNGINVDVAGELFVTDNQGDWVPSSKLLHIIPGAWYGSRSVDPEGTATLKEKLPVVWLPQDDIGNSPSQPVPINVGPYKGQMLHGEVTHGGFKRVFMEKVNGDYQGVVFRFTQGLEGGVNRAVWGSDGALYAGMIGNPGNWSHAGGKWFGLQKMIWTGNPTFEMLAVRAKTNGMEIEMTEPIADGDGNAIEDYEVKQWYYKPTADYGGPKLDERKLAVKSVNVSADRKKVFLAIDGMQPNHIVYIRLKGVFKSKANLSLWATEAWYTLNQIPQHTPGFTSPQVKIAANTLTEAEVKEGWKLLFDGKTTAGWRSYKREKTGSAWVVRDGALTLNKPFNAPNNLEGGDIITVDEYENYELALEWKIEKCGNSGIIFNVVEANEYNAVWQTGPEMQILDNLCHPDARIEKHRAGDLYDLIESNFVAVNPVGEWNRIRLIANRGKYEFWLNGHRVVSFEMNTQAWNDLVSKSKFKDMPGFGKSRKGHIALQDHGNQVWFRNVKIKVIK